MHEMIEMINARSRVTRWSDGLTTDGWVGTLPAMIVGAALDKA